MDDLKNFKDIKEVFKRFQKDRHNEDKGKNFNLLQDVFSSAELFDVTKFPLPVIKYDIEDFGMMISYNSKVLKNLSLPFACQFIHVDDKQYSINNKLYNSSTYMFLREFSPIHITGTIYTINEEGRRNLPFSINLFTGDISIMSSDYKKVTPAFAIIPYYSKNELINIILNTVTCVCTLSDKKVLCETPIQAHTEYYRRKGATAIQVLNRKIYYILSKDDVKYENIIREHSTGHIEYTHAFKVRGHWRTLDSKSKGKDRAGNRVIDGYTWVTEYVKGEGELVKKIREIQ